MVFIMALPASMAVLAAVHGILAARTNKRAFEAHSERVKGLR